VSPFRLLGHPLHPALVHLPMGLLLSTPLWDALAWRGGGAWWTVAAATCGLGVLGALVAAVAGVADLLTLEPDSPAQRTALWHMVVMLVAVSAFGATLLVRRGDAPTGGALTAVLACDAAGLVSLGLGGFLGGELVYRHGAGVHPAHPEGAAHEERAQRASK
jgi:uncharacterized membrane protein